MREKKERVMGLKSVAVVDPKQLRNRLPDPEEFHQRSELTSEIELRKLMQVQMPKQKGGNLSDVLAFDDLTGMVLDTAGVKEAREKEMNV